MGPVPEAYYDFVVDYAPYIYVVPPDTPDTGMGKGAFAAAFAIDFLYKAYYSVQFVDRKVEILVKVVELADWMLTQQCLDSGKEAYGGFKSTETSTYYYAVDACRVIPSLLRAYSLTDDTDYLESAKLAALTFLKKMQDKQAYGGFARAVTIGDAWLLEMDVECLYGLIGLKMLQDTYDKGNASTYQSMIASAVGFLREGFEGKWLHYDPADDEWHRVGLSENEIYDDPLAYALLGLYFYEGWSVSCSSLYSFINCVGGGETYPEYDPEVCWAGYIDVVSEVVACDYYDAVTAGILGEVRRHHDPSSFCKSIGLISAFPEEFMFWGVKFSDYSPVENKKAMATVCWLAQAFLEYNVHRWQVTYYDSAQTGWVDVYGAVVDEVLEELDGHEEAVFLLPNKQANRTFVETDHLIRVLFDGEQAFLGVLSGVEYSAKCLKCFVYNGVYELLKRRVISGSYVNVSASAVAEAVRVAAGLVNPLGSCPSTLISVEFDQNLCYDAIKQITEILNADFWTQNGDTLYIGSRGSIKTFEGPLAIVSSRGVDRSKRRDKVHVRGFNSEGDQLLGVAGTGDNVAVFWSHVASSKATLDLIAAKKLAELNRDDGSVSLTCPVTDGVHLHPGDQITITKPILNLNGLYRVKKVRKARKTVEVEVSFKKKVDEILEDLLKDQNNSFSFASKGAEVIDNLSLKPALISGATIKPSYDISTRYLKEACVLPGGVALASPTGNMNSYEAGYVALSLIEKNGAGERDLARDILDLFADNQNADGSWYQQYNPYKNSEGKYGHVEEIATGVSGDLKVDSGAALLAWAMSRYDQETSGTRYQTVVRKALQFLRDLQYAHLVEHSTNLLANLVLEGVMDTYAFAADCAECLLAMKAALDAYGESLATDPGGYSVKIMANDLYYSMCTATWIGEGEDYYHTSYPVDGEVLVPFAFKEKLSYTQALCSWANYEWANSGYLTVSDYSSQCQLCLDFILPLTSGQWGGVFYSPFYGGIDEAQEEFSGYTALMIIACNAVDSGKYADAVARMAAFLKWVALGDGRLFDCADVNGRLWRAKVATVGDVEEAYGFLSLPVAQALLAGV